MDYSEFIKTIREQDMKFMKPVSKMTNKEIVDEYTLHGLNYLQPSDVIKAFKDKPENLMDEDNYAYYVTLPDEVVAYRGCALSEANMEDEDGCVGISWTLDYKVAEFFAYRYGSKGRCIIKAVVPKDSVRYYTNDRKESEIITFFPDYEIVSKEEGDNYNCGDFHKYLDEKYEKD